jgi:Leucine-rich repeat (LRR) protein
LTGVWCYNNQLSSIDISNSEALVSLSCLNNKLGWLDLRANKALLYLWCQKNANLKTVCLNTTQMMLTNNFISVLEKDATCAWSTKCKISPTVAVKSLKKAKK